MKRDDPNFATYAEGADDLENIRYYMLQAEKLKAEEKVNMFIDYSHVSQFEFKDQNF